MKSTELKMHKAGKGGLNELKQQMAREKDFIVFFLLRVELEYDEDSNKT